MSDLPLDPVVAADLRRLVGEVLAEVLPGLRSADGRTASAAMASRAEPPAPRLRLTALPATVPSAGGVPSGVPVGHTAPADATPPRPATAADGTRADSRDVRISTDAELREFALRVLRLADNPKLRRDLIAGRIRFRLAEQPAGAAVREAHRVEKGAVTERIVAAAAKAGVTLVLGPRAVLTPLAADKARALGVPIEKER